MRQGGEYRFGPFEVRTGARELFKAGTKIKLRGQPYLILEVLLSRAGEVVTRDELRERLWPADTFVDFEHGLNTSVKKLRQVLFDSAEEPRYIETVPRLGYRFIAAVEVVRNGTGPPPEVHAVESVVVPALLPALSSRIEPIKQTQVKQPQSEQPQGEQSRRSRGRILRISFAAAALLGTAFVVVVAKSPSATRRFLGTLLGGSDGTVKASVARRFGSIAVLPLQSISNEPSQEYFSDGMTDELITDLAQLKNVRVISRTSVMHYKGTKQTVPQIGRELGVDALVEGTVERAGDRVRIRVQLIDAANDRHLWARSYDHELKDLLVLESTAAHDIATEIQDQLGVPNVNSHSVNGESVQPEAYEAYLKGRYFSNQRSEAGVQKSIEYFEEAIAKEPSFAAAYAGLAGCYSLLGSDVMAPEVAREKARAAANKALQLDPTIAEGHAELGLVAFYYDWNWKQAEQELQRAIELNPSYGPGHQGYSYYLRAMGRLPEALQEAKQAQQLDPLSLAINTTLAGRYRDLGQYDQALTVIRHTLELNPNFEMAHELLASVYELQGNLESSVSEWQKAVELSPDNPSVLAALGHAYAISGNRTGARKVVERLKPMSKQHYLPAWDMAVLFASLGDADGAFRWLEKSYRERESQMPFLKQDRRLAVLRSDPRFQDLVRRVGLPE